jgi:hypothetical protein
MNHAEQLGLVSMVLVAGLVSKHKKLVHRLAADVSQNQFRKHQARNSGKGRPGRGCLGGGGAGEWEKVGVVWHWLRNDI